MQGQSGNGLFSRWSTGHQPIDQQLHERDTSVISPNVQRVYREKDVKHGGFEDSSINPERQRKKLSAEEIEKAPCLSSCGRASSSMSWIYDKKEPAQGKNTFATTVMTEQGTGKVRTNSSGHVDDTSHNGHTLEQNSRSISENYRTYAHKKLQVESNQRMCNYSSQSSTSKAQEFLHGNDSDEEFFNAQPEDLLDVSSKTYSEMSRSQQVNSSATFTYPRTISKQQKGQLRNPNHPQHHSLGRFSPQPPKYPSKTQSNSQQLQVIQEEPLQCEDGPYIQISNTSGKNHKDPKPYVGESRIVAPNVSKLSPNSAVEVRLQSATDSVVVLCSVDVLKMRSGFFHNILNEQERQFMSHQGAGALTSSSTNAPLSTNGHVLWRETIILDEQCPYEAAAFLESIHEGRAVFRGEWNYCWARLSVAWIVEDLILEYATQIDQHILNIVSIIQQYHWRTNPNIIAGMRICIFRKGSNPSPTIVSGTVLESPGTVSYSKVRVAFDNSSTNSLHQNHAILTPNQLMAMDRTPMKPVTTMYHPSNANSTSNVAPPKSMLSPRIGKATPPIPFHQIQIPQQQAEHNLNHVTMQLMQPPSSPQPTTMNCNPITNATNGNNYSSNIQAGINTSMMMNHQIVGDVAEPFWVQSTTAELAQWYDPDELFSNEAKKLLTITDKRIFWEMARAIIDLPEISKVCKGTIRTVQDLVSMLKRAEFRVLWTPEAANIFPSAASADLIRFAFAGSQMQNSNSHGLMNDDNARNNISNTNAAMTIGNNGTNSNVVTQEFSSAIER